MNSSTKQKFREFLTNNGKYLEFQQLIPKKTSLSYNQYVEYVESIYAITRISNCLDEESQQEFNNINKEWLNIVVHNCISSSLHKYAEKYSISSVVDAIKYLIDNDLWNSPEGDEFIKDNKAKEQTRKEYLPAIDEAILYLKEQKAKEEPQEAESEIKVDDTNINGVEDSEVVVAKEYYATESADNFRFWREEWRPSQYLKPTGVYNNSGVFVVLAEGVNYDGTKKQSVRMAHFDGENFWWGKDSKGQKVVLNTVAWIPYPCRNLINEGPDLRYPIEILYANLVKSNRRNIGRITSYERKIQNLEQVINDARAKHEEIGVYKEKAKIATEFAQRLSEKAKAYDDVCGRLEKAEQELKDSKKKLNATIPMSSLLELPLIGRKAISVLKPFLAKYNITIDEKK